MKTRKGGQKVVYKKPLTMQTIHSNDCGASVMVALNYMNPEDGIYLATRTPKGIYPQIILSMLTIAYGDGLSWKPLRKNSINNNEATIAYIYWENSNPIKKGLHYFIIYKIDDTLRALDPQSGIDGIFDDDFMMTITIRETTKIQLMFIDSPTIIDENPLVTQSIINRALEMEEFPHLPVMPAMGEAMEPDIGILDNI
jgi:hypothetical protein